MLVPFGPLGDPCPKTAGGHSDPHACLESPRAGTPNMAHRHIYEKLFDPASGLSDPSGVTALPGPAWADNSSLGAGLASLQADLSIQDDLLATFQADLSVQDALPATLQTDPSVRDDLLASSQADLSARDDLMPILPSKF